MLYHSRSIHSFSLHSTMLLHALPNTQGEWILGKQWLWVWHTPGSQAGGKEQRAIQVTSREKGSPGGTWIVRGALQSGGGGCQATWGCARFSVHLLPFPCRLTISSRFCASAPPNSACDRLWVAMVTTGTPILYVLTIPGSTSPGCGWVFLSLNSTPSWRGVGGHLFQTINLLLHPQQRRRGQSPKGQSLGRDPKIVYYEQTKGEGTSKHPFQIIISTVF